MIDFLTVTEVALGFLAGVVARDIVRAVWVKFVAKGE